MALFASNEGLGLGFASLIKKKATCGDHNAINYDNYCKFVCTYLANKNLKTVDLLVTYKVITFVIIETTQSMFRYQNL